VRRPFQPGLGDLRARLLQRALVQVPSNGTRAVGAFRFVCLNGAVPRQLSHAIVMVGLFSLLAASAFARSAASPTVAACAQKTARVPGHTNRTSNVMDCLWPKTIVVSGTVSWTNCPSAPASEPECREGVITVRFRSTASGFRLAPGLFQPEPWGGTFVPSTPGGNKGYNPTWGIWGLPGTGTLRCTAATIDRPMKLRVLDSDRTFPLRDQAVGLAVFGTSIRISSSLHPGFHGPLGQGALFRIFGTEDGCVLPTFALEPPAVRTKWPGTVVRSTALLGADPIVRVNDVSTRRQPIPSASWLGGPTIVITYRWSSSIVFAPRF